MSEVSANNKRIAKNTLLLYLRSIFLIFIYLFTSREVLKTLGISDYGIYQLVGGVVSMFTMLSNSMTSASQRYITFALGEGDNKKMQIVFSTSLTLHLFIGFLLVVLLELGGIYILYYHLNIPETRINAAFWVMQCSILTLFFNVVSIPYNALIIAHECMAAFAYISLLDAILKLSIVYVLYVLDVDKLILYAILMSLISIVVRIIYSQYCKKKFIEARHIRLGIEKGLFKEMLAFAGWNLWGNGSLVLRNQGIDILMNVFYGVTVNAAKGICNQVQSAVGQFVSNFQAAVTPQLTKSIAQADLSRTHLLMFQGSRLSFYLLMIFSVPLMISCQFVLSLWLVEVPSYTIEFIRWTLMYMLMDTLSRFLINSILAIGKIRNYQVIVSSFKLLALPLAYVCFKNEWGPLAGLWINLALEVICLGVRLHFTRKTIAFPVYDYLFKVVLKCWLVFAIAYVLSYVLSYNWLGQSIVIMVISFIITFMTIYILGMTRKEKELVLIKFYEKLKKNR